MTPWLQEGAAADPECRNACFPWAGCQGMGMETGAGLPSSPLDPSYHYGDTVDALDFLLFLFLP